MKQGPQFERTFARLRYLLGLGGLEGLLGGSHLSLKLIMSQVFLVPSKLDTCTWVMETRRVQL